MNLRLSSFAPVLLMGAVVFSACGPGEDPDPIPDAGPTSTAAEADPVRSTVTLSPSSGSLANGTDEVLINIVVKHRSGALLSGQAVTVEVTGTGNTLVQPPSPSDAQGMARATLKSSVPELKTVTVTVTNEDGTAVVLKSTPTVEFAELPPTKLVFESQPQDATAGASLGSVRLSIQNDRGEVVPRNVEVSLLLESSTVELAGTRKLVAVDGIVEFTDLAVTKVGTDYTILASAAGLPDATSGTFSIVPAAPTRLSISGVTSPIVAGDFTGVAVSAFDEFDNRATNFTGLVHFETTDPQDTVPADTAFPADDSGFLTLPSGIVLKTMGSHTLTVSLVDDPSIKATAIIDVGPDAVAEAVITTQPTNVQTNAPFTVTVELRDAYGNLTQANMPQITLSLKGSPTGYTLGGTLVKSPNDGLATFDDLTIDNQTPTGTTLQINVAAGMLPSIDTTAFAVADTTPPATISDFQAGSVALTSITLNWTGPGDDGLIGNASAYVLKYSTTQITQTNFATTGTTVTTAAPRGGGSESVVVSGLTQNTGYFFALEASDDAGNKSYAFTSATTANDPCAGVATDDGVACTVDACDPATGNVTHTPDQTACPFASACTASGCAAPTQTGAVLVTEFLAIPGTGATEFIELHNPGAVAIDVAGWSFENSTEQAEIRSISDLDGAANTAVTIPAGGYVVGIVNPAVAPDPSSAAFVIGAPGSTFNVADTGDGLMLWALDGSVADLVDFRTTLKTADPLGATDFPARTGVSTQLEPTKHSATDNDSGANWCSTFYSATTRSNVADTRGAANGSCSAVVINEVVFDAASDGTSAADDGRAFVELAGPAGASLTGLRLAGLNLDGTPTMDLDLTFGATHPARLSLTGLLVVADEQGTSGTSTVPNADIITAADAQNGPNSIALYAPGDVLIDALGYGAGVTVVEGSPAPLATPVDFVTLSYARSAASADTGDNAADFHLDPTPTPGAANAPLVPELLSLDVNDGPAAGGTVVTVTGRDFAAIGSLEGTTDLALQAFFGASAPVACTVTGSTDDGRGTVTFTCTAPAGTAGVTDFTVANPPALGGGSSLTGAWTYTAAANETDTADEVDYCVLQAPSALTVTSGAPSDLVYGRIYQAGVTENGGTAGILAELGYGAASTDPISNPNWRFFAATYNLHVGNDAEFQASIPAPIAAATTNFAYTYRFSFDGVNWTYCDLDGAGANTGLTFDSAQLGVMTVNP